MNWKNELKDFEKKCFKSEIEYVTTLRKHLNKIEKLGGKISKINPEDGSYEIKLPNSINEREKVLMFLLYLCKYDNIEITLKTKNFVKIVMG